MTNTQVAWLAILISVAVIVMQGAEMLVTLRDRENRELFWPWNRKARAARKSRELERGQR